MKSAGVISGNRAFVLPEAAWVKQQKLANIVLRKALGSYGYVRLRIGLRRHICYLSQALPEIPHPFCAATISLKEKLIWLGALYKALACMRKKRDTEEIMRRILQNMAAIAIPAIYRIDELVACEGDSFDNYKASTRAMFVFFQQTGAWHCREMRERDHLLEIKVDSCLFVEFFRAAGCMEITPLICEHGAAGYRLLETATGSVFERPRSLAGGDDHCCFRFLRKS